MGRFPVEPFNTYSNLIFLFIIVVYAIRTKLNFARYPLIVSALPVLLIGFTGGTLFHATRGRNLWLFMDFIPIITLGAMAAIYFWFKVTGRVLASLLLSLGPIALIQMVHHVSTFSKMFRISIGYTLIAAILIIPAVLWAKKTGGQGISCLFAAVCWFAAAITCRSIDLVLNGSFLPMGTHFLWHIFGGLSVFLLIRFVEKQNDAEC